MANLETLTDETFESTIQSSEAPVLIDFSADWCQPCKLLAPTIEAIAGEYDGRLKVYAVDVENAAATAGKLGISGVPTVVFFKGGREVDRFVGNRDIASVREIVEKVV